MSEPKIPTEPGWYWMKLRLGPAADADDHRLNVPFPVFVEKVGNARTLMCGRGVGGYIDHPAYSWGPPIDPYEGPFAYFDEETSQVAYDSMRPACICPRVFVGPPKRVPNCPIVGHGEWVEAKHICVWCGARMLVRLRDRKQRCANDCASGLGQCPEKFMPDEGETP